MVGPWLVLIIVGGLTVLGIARGVWKIPAIIMGMLLLGALYGNFPHLPAAINSGLTGVVNSVTK
jgi:hypothetical protein